MKLEPRRGDKDYIVASAGYGRTRRELPGPSRASSSMPPMKKRRILQRSKERIFAYHRAGDRQFQVFFKKDKNSLFRGFYRYIRTERPGKSNIIDSILFVLALSSSRNLRAEKLTDLINLNSGGTPRKSPSSSRTVPDPARIKRNGNGYYELQLPQRAALQAERHRRPPGEARDQTPWL